MPQIYEVVEGLVNEKFATSMEYANGAYQVATGLINELSSVNLAPNFSTVEVGFEPISGQAQFADAPEAPVIQTSGADAPVAPEYAEIQLVENPDIPKLEISAPSINIPAAPVMDTYVLPGSPPSIAAVDLPADIVLTEKDEPELSDIFIPVKPNIVIPVPPAPDLPMFSGDYDDIRLDVDTVFSEVNAAVRFLQDEVSGVASTILDLVKNPKMAIGDTIRDQMIARDKQKLADEYAARQAELINSYSNRGWGVPTGIMAAKLAELDRLHYVAQDNLMRDYTLKEWELSQQNWQTAVQVIPQYTNSLVGLTDSVLGKTIEMAKYAFEAAYNKYRAATEIYRQDIEVYKNAFMVYELQVKAQELLLELYNAEMTGAKIQVETDSVRADLWKTYVSMQGAKVDLYKANLQGAIAKMDYSKTAIELYRAQIEGFVAGMSSNNAKVQLYQGRIAGEESKLKLFNTQVAGYGAVLDTVKTQSSIKLANSNMTIESNKSLAQRYETDIRKYSEQLKEIGTRNDAAAKIFGGQVAAYEANIKKGATEIDALIKEGELNIRGAAIVVDAQIKQADMNMHNANVAAQIQTEAMKGAGGVAAQLAASAMSAVSAGVHLGAESKEEESWTHSEVVRPT
ncbi:MAG: hypothetical protein HY881_16030 [Deltaproteobacteria bacterium]|nr:hypothetical protein [Deltaproteobacteria bacterium]